MQFGDENVHRKLNRARVFQQNAGPFFGQQVAKQALTRAGFDQTAIHGTIVLFPVAQVQEMPAWNMFGFRQGLAHGLGVALGVP